MASELTLVISNNDVNRYGFRVLTEGIRTENYLKNPVVLAYHEDRLVSVGKATRLEKKLNGEFVATVDFDENDPFALLVFNKYKNGYMNATSLGLLELVESANEKDLIQGQSYPTIVESEMLEMSLVNVPGNAGCVKLYNSEMNEIKLSMIESKPNLKPMSKDEKTVEQLQEENRALRKTLAGEMVALHVKRGSIEAGEADFFTKSAENDFEGTKKVLEMRPEKKDENAEKAKALVELHFTRGAITSDEKTFFEKSAISDYEGAKKMLEAKKGKDAVDQFLGSAPASASASAQGNDDKAKWTYLDFYKKDQPGLIKMKAETPDKYKTLLEAHKKALRDSGKVQIDEDTED